MKQLLIHIGTTLLCFVLGAAGSLLWDNYSKDMPRQMPPVELEKAENQLVAEMEQSALRIGIMSAFSGLAISLLVSRKKR